MNKTCFIFGAGPFYGLREKPQWGDSIIAADGGYRHCTTAGLQPDILLGDFDSIEKMPPHGEVFRFPVEKDDTDMMLALKTGLERSAQVFHIYGGTGGRLDHTIANLQALLFLAEHGAQGFLHDEHVTYTAIQNSSLTLPSKMEGIFSVFCFGRDAKGVWITGAQYPLQDATLTAGFPIGVSNHFIGETVKITVKDGGLVIGWEID